MARKSLLRLVLMFMEKFIFTPLLLKTGGTRSRYFKTFNEPRNRLQGINSASLCSLAGRYDNPIPTWFLTPRDCSKIPALAADGLKCGGK